MSKMIVTTEQFQKYLDRPSTRRIDANTAALVGSGTVIWTANPPPLEANVASTKAPRKPRAKAAATKAPRKPRAKKS